MSSNHPMPPELERKLYLEGIELFNEHAYFDAHESWEEVWHLVYGDRKRFYQGMIQCSVALEHYRRGNARGVASLYKSYPPKFRGLPDVFMGLDLRTFLGQMRAIVRPVAEADPLPPQGAIELDLSRCPRITLQYDPFETGEA